MEPIITLTYIVTTFFGYYVGADIWNQTKLKSEMDEVKNRLHNISSSLNRIDSKLN
jgi:hypothetical protein